jgi:cytochrome b involved in lipid metabolism/CDGSH-type Zn-finger protein
MSLEPPKNLNSKHRCSSCTFSRGSPADIEETVKRRQVYAKINRHSASSIEFLVEMKSDDVDLRSRLTSSDTGILNTKVALCTCQQSRTFPVCDNSHVVFNKETNSNVKPLLVTFLEESMCSVCTAKLENKERAELESNNSKYIMDNETNPPQDELQTRDLLATCTSTNDEATDHNTPSTLQSELDTPSTTSDTTTPSTPNCEQPVQPKYKPSSIKDKTNQQNYITQEEVAEHCTKESLWMIINGKVYDITQYVQHHPGGARALLKFAGKDGSENIEFHSKKMLEILNSYYFIGHLKKDKEQGSNCIIS